MTNIKMAERLAGLESDVRHIKERIDRFITCADNKYASKLTEKIVYGLCTLVLVAFISKVLNLW